ncbi:hypothetical protein HRbin02_00096 [Candidatus Calditenuaceae archaeon HR02]|nr:hypothetical protein HRbin02_00096 [Candidatus Calditenuaceae archaeon HR02]
MRLAASLLLLVLVLSQLGLGQGQGESLTVRVFDISGSPRGGVELRLSNSTFTRMFETTAQGVAEFRLIAPGVYNLSALVDGIVVAQTTISFPAQTRVNLTLHIQNIDLLIYDLDGRPASGVSIELKSENGPVIRRGSTDSNGKVSIRDLPFSNLSQVGPYRVLGRLGEVTVLNSTISVTPQVSEYSLTAEIIKVGITILDYRGGAVNATLKLSSESLNFSTSLAAGKTYNIPSSKVAGPYIIEASKRYSPQAPEILLFKETALLDRSQNLTYVLDLSDMVVVVRDDAGSAVRGLRVLIESEKLGVLGSSTTSTSGEATFSAIPFSEGRPGAGVYRITVYKDSFRLGVMDVNLVPGFEMVTVTVNRVETMLYIHTPRGQPLPNATITLLDPSTRRIYTATSDSEGRAALYLIPGAHHYSVTYMGVEVASGDVNATVPRILIQATKVDIEFRVRVSDWAGNVLRDAKVSIVWRGQELESVRQDDGSIQARVPVAGEVQVNIYLDDSLVERRLVWVSSPTLFETRLRGVLVGGRLVDIEAVSSTVAGVFLAISAASIFILWRHRASRVTVR